MPELIDRKHTEQAVEAYLCSRCEMNSNEVCHNCPHLDGAKILRSVPTIEAEPVRHGNGCSYCKGRSYTKKPLTVITRTMKRVEVCFNFCPNCGRDLRATDTNVGGKGGADNG